MPKTPSRSELVPVEDAPLAPALLRRAGSVLAEGGIVALPTETVYGLATRADDEDALRRLARLKRRPDGPGFTWHVPEDDALERFDALRPLARRLAGRYWPGPLTLVLHGVPPGLEKIAADGWTGVRRPGHRATRDLLAGVGFPLVLTSANVHGQPPLSRAPEIRELFGESVPLVLDGGPSRLAESSGVLRLGPGRFELLREGLLPISDLRRTAGLRIGFVCTGNTCRSPMAEALARRLLSERLGVSPAPGSPGSTGGIGDFGFEIASMGLLASIGSPASGHAVEAMRERGIDLSGHRSRPARLEELTTLDRTFALTSAHLGELRSLLPPDKAAAVELLDPAGSDVPDPIGGSLDDYRRCAERIRAAIERRLPGWA